MNHRVHFTFSPLTVCNGSSSWLKLGTSNIWPNMQRHRTDGFSSSKSLVVRRGAPFKLSLQLGGREFDPKSDCLRVKVMLGRLCVRMAVTFSKRVSSSRWTAYMESKNLDLQNPSVFISAPSSAPVGCYRFQLHVYSQGGRRRTALGKFLLLCNPWCGDDDVYIPFEDQREEYVANDAGLLFMGTAVNLVSRPWSFDQYEPGVLESCMSLLQVSPKHQTNQRLDYLKRNDPVYISRVVSAMINCEDDCGVLKGNWSGDFKNGVSPTTWTGSGDILNQWAKSGYKPVKYGQCWVFAAVMCTVMRVLGIPCRVVTNFNSAHDTNGNLVIEEYYSEKGEKLKLSKDSVWNFHVWVECWMARKDLGSGMDGWQVLDPTPQNRSGGVFCCGPSPVKAIKKRCMEMFYDIPFVYAEVNADIHMIIMSQGRVLSLSKDTEKVGSLICTKAIGFPRLENITGDYKLIKSPTSTLSSRTSTISDRSTSRTGDRSQVFVILSLDKAPVAGEPVSFTVKLINKQKMRKAMKLHLNAQAKEYNHSPSDTFWVDRFEPSTPPKTEYEDVVGDDLINLAAVVEDMSSHERTLASEEFNIATPKLTIQVLDENSVKVNEEQTAIVSFKNPYSHLVGGELIVAGAGLIQGKILFRYQLEHRITFTPNMVGTKMLQASLKLSNINSTIRGFKMVIVDKD
uniref:protein-glutamine gamma-glutamyltransferase n=1 Tax=Cynoglossus semilaevis TaxID=244447 RepID=A0A3P8WTC8_CYNSE